MALPVYIEIQNAKNLRNHSWEAGDVKTLNDPAAGGVFDFSYFSSVSFCSAILPAAVSLSVSFNLA
jgi:hypothetical protein